MKVFALPYFDGGNSAIDPFDRFQIRANAIVCRGIQIATSYGHPEKTRQYQQQLELDFDVQEYLRTQQDRIWDSEEIERVSVSLSITPGQILGRPRTMTLDERTQLSRDLGEDEETCTDEDLFQLRFSLRAWDEIDAIAKQRRQK